MDNQIFVMDHPLIQHKLTFLRDKHTGTKEFRALVSEIATLMCYEATRDLPLQEVEIETPMCKATTKVIAGRKLAFVPILRAGLGMVEGCSSLCRARKSAISACTATTIRCSRSSITTSCRRISRSATSSCSTRCSRPAVPRSTRSRSSSAAVPKSIKFLCVIAAPEGLRALSEAHPDVHIYCAAVDEKLNENGYILPGLGDAGDRIFGTK